CDCCTLLALNVLVAQRALGLRLHDIDPVGRANEEVRGIARWHPIGLEIGPMKKVMAILMDLREGLNLRVVVSPRDELTFQSAAAWDRQARIDALLHFDRA